MKKSILLFTITLAISILLTQPPTIADNFFTNNPIILITSPNIYDYTPTTFGVPPHQILMMINYGNPVIELKNGMLYVSTVFKSNNAKATISIGTLYNSGYVNISAEIVPTASYDTASAIGLYDLNTHYYILFGTHHGFCGGSRSLILYYGQNTFRPIKSDDHYGASDWTPGQTYVINLILNKNEIVAVFKTPTGKIIKEYTATVSGFNKGDYLRIIIGFDEDAVCGVCGACNRPQIGYFKYIHATIGQPNSIFIPNPPETIPQRIIEHLNEEKS